MSVLGFSMKLNKIQNIFTNLGLKYLYQFKFSRILRFPAATRNCTCVSSSAIIVSVYL